MQRRDFLKRFTHGAAGLAGAGMLAGEQGKRPASKQPVPRRNVLLLYCEQFQHDVASYAGGPTATPNLAALSGHAANFQTACTTTALCSPARGALLTGRWGHRTGMDDNCHVWQSRLIELDYRQTTLIEWAKRAGYFVGYYGKWHLGPDGPIRRGTDRFPEEGFERQASRRGAKPMPKPDFEMARKYDGKLSLAEKPGYYSTVEGTYEDTECHRLARQGAQFLDEVAKDGRPFFLTVSFWAVHPPYRVPKPYSGMYDPAAVKLPINVHDSFERKPADHREILWPYHDTRHMTDGDWRRAAAFYRAYVTMLDRSIGEVLDALRRSGQWENTMVVFVADHGDMCGAHGLFDKGPYSYDEVMRIPLLVRVPGLPAKEITRHVASIDLNRTMAEWMRLKPDIPNTDSRSLFPLIERGNAGWDEADQAFLHNEWYNGHWYGIRTIRTPQLKYCFNSVAVDELYDLRSDPGELKNLIDVPALRDTQRQLQARLLAHLEKIEDPLRLKVKACLA